MKRPHAWIIAAALLSAACGKSPVQPEAERIDYSQRRDYHSYSNPQEVRARHVSLDLAVLFDQKILKGSATLAIERTSEGRGKPLILDTRGLKILGAEASAQGKSYGPVKFELGQYDKVLGSPLTLYLPQDASHVRIHYETSPQASGLQWLTPEQTAGRKFPFLYTQSQAIHARSWIPLQDTPGVRVTYSARIRTPRQLRAVMSSRNDPKTPLNGEFTFDMPQPVPSYLIALAVGELEYRPISQRTGVYAEKPVAGKAAKEFEDTEQMMQAAERLYGPYRWDQYDILVLPPSFPFGGMENPRLTFATPMILAGDKSLVGLIAHELAHSWSGNLVTNATWRDFWLNEGFTVYFENRIQEEVYGRARAEMEAVLEKQELEREMADLPAADEILYINLKGRDPDEGFTQVPYVKGMLFLRRLEEVFGRDKFDAFLRSYFQKFSFQSIVTGDFVEYLQHNLLRPDPELAAKIHIDDWLSKPGLPEDTPQPQSDAFAKVSGFARGWLSGKIEPAAIPVKTWTTQEWLHFLKSLPAGLDGPRMAALDKAFGLTRSGNSEILFEWLLMSIRSGYEPAYPQLERFLTEVGRRKYIKPLYEELVETPAGKQKAAAIYARARPGYHPIAQTTIDEVMREANKQKKEGGRPQP
jgi:aminopeptidase N